MISYILFSSLIFEIQIHKLKEILFKSGILSTIIFLFIYLKAYLISGSNIYNSHHGRLMFIGPNPIALGVLITLIFTSSGNQNIKKISNLLIIIPINTFLITILFQTQSRAYLLCGIINLLLLLFFKKRK